MKTLKNIIKENSDQLAERLLECNSFNKQEMSSIVSAHLAIAISAISKMKIINYDNELQQLNNQLTSPNITSSERDRIQGKIKELKTLAGKNHVLIAEAARDNKYRKLRIFLKNKGLTEILEEFDAQNLTEN